MSDSPQVQAGCKDLTDSNMSLLDLTQEFSDEPLRLGIMGGTFDPIHLGHLVAADQVRQALSLDKIIFMPAGSPVYKQGTTGASPEARMEMVRLAIQDNPYFVASDLEIARSGLTYTIDTLEALQEMYQGRAELFFITGADALDSLPSWKRADEISSFAHLVGVTRPGYTLELTTSLKDTIKDLTRLHLIEVSALAISSSDIRKRLNHGFRVRYLIPDKVAAFIEAQDLYQGSC